MSKNAVRFVSFALLAAVLLAACAPQTPAPEPAVAVETTSTAEIQPSESAPMATVTWIRSLLKMPVSLSWMRWDARSSLNALLNA